MTNFRNYPRKPWYRKNSNNKTSVSEPTFFDGAPQHGYAGFRLYFPDLDDEDGINNVLQHVSSFQRFIKRNQSTYALSNIEDMFFTVDYKDLITDAELNAEWTNFKEDVIINTEYCLNCMGLAIHQSIIMKRDLDANLKTVRARLVNFEPIVQLKDLRVNSYGKLVSVRGTVIKAGNVKILCQYMAFSCAACTGVQLVKQVEGAFSLPTKCPSKGCRAQSNFTALHSSSHTRTIDYQTLKIQELIGSEECENGRIPRMLHCELTEDLVNSCVPGDDVTIVGVLKVQNNADSGNKSKQNSLFSLHLVVVSVINNKNHAEGSYGASERIQFNFRDYYAIQKIHAQDELFRFLVHSLCPLIYGHEIVKAGLLLALFGGAKSDRTRAESHVLMVGDPGLGKSQMLQACTNVAPRGVYVCGNTSTGSGLTVTMTRESRGEFALEAGALMLADQGCCCIDEFDKMPTQHACLLEAMEQQSISIAKAGVVCSLPTRTTILAAANPAGGHYNKAKTIAENLKIGSPMLSRFDLIFIILDQPNEELDMQLSEHILALHSGGKNLHPNLNLSHSDLSQADLSARLKPRPDEVVDHLPHSLFRKYIAYAQKYVNPQLSVGAKTVIKTFYSKLRRQFRTGDCTPVTTRQLNSLIRLTQARAKAELREEATENDALDVVEIMKHSLVDIFTDEVGLLDTTRSQNGTGISSKNQVKKLLALLQRRSEAQAKSIFTVQEIRELSEEVGICKSKFFSVLDSLNIHGYILNKGSSRYQLVTAE